MCNGVLAGCVAICAGAGWVRPWAALIIGVLGSLRSVYAVYSPSLSRLLARSFFLSSVCPLDVSTSTMTFSERLCRWRIDDAVDASAVRSRVFDGLTVPRHMPFVQVHGAAGFVGVLLLPFFKADTGILYAWDADSFRFLGWQILGAIVILSWVTVVMILVLLPLRSFDLLRVSERSEMMGSYSLQY